ncbi:MAG: hypothetical protein IJS74_03895 [Clostridia bacterium]|nr:hypothetical protein [Clostridia bacterium]
MITKEQIIEQYAEMLRDKDDQLSESESIKQAKQKYLEDEVLAKDFDEYTATNCFWSTPQNLISDAKPEEFANTPKSFLSVCASGLHKTCGEDLPRKDLDDFLGKAIEAGVNLEGVKKQAYMRLEMMSKSGLEYNPDDIAALRATIAYCNDNELSSPYYELKDNQKMINYYQEQIAKNPEKAEEYRKKIQERENANIDFLENCDKQGIDRELAEEYLKDCKANLQREANQKKQNSMKVEDSQQKKTENESGNYTEEERARTVKTESYHWNWSRPAEKQQEASDPESDGTKARYESQRQVAAQRQQEIMEEKEHIHQQEVRPVTKEEIDTTIKENSEFDYMRQEQQQYKEQLRREAEERARQKEENTYVDQYGVVRQRVNEEMQQSQQQGMSRGR